MIKVAISTGRVGDIAESCVMGELLKRGYSVSIPFNSCRYDLIAEQLGRFRRIQVKYVGGSTETNTIPVVLHSICRKGRVKYTKNDIDFVVVYLAANGRFYIVPAKDFGGKMVLHLRLVESKNKQKRNITLASTYENKWNLLE